MSATILQLRPVADLNDIRDQFLQSLNRSKLALNSKLAYEQQVRAYFTWLLANPEHGAEAFRDLIGAEATVTLWKRLLLAKGRAASTVNQAMGALTLCYEFHGLRIVVKRVAEGPRPAPAALSRNQENALRRAADRSGARDAAMIFLFLETGARVEELSRLELTDLSITTKTGAVRLLGKGDQVRSNLVPNEARKRMKDWLLTRQGQLAGKPDHGKLWLGRSGVLTRAGVTQAVLRIGTAAGIEGLTPHVLRHTFATRCSREGMNLAVLQALMGHRSIETTARYIRASQEEIDAEVARIFD